MNAHVMLVADLGFGDAGKGTIVDFLARVHHAHTVVRYNGGSQAAHNVVTPDGRHHTFAQFGSATFLPGVRTYLSRFMVLDPLALRNEEKHLAALGVYDAYERLFVDRDTPIITPFHVAMNRLREMARGDRRFGSCGMGVGETIRDAALLTDMALRAGDLHDRTAIERKLRLLYEIKRGALEMLESALPKNERVARELSAFDETAVLDFTGMLFEAGKRINVVGGEWLRAALAPVGAVIFEGAQGVLLDVERGFRPFVTKSDTTFANAERLLNESGHKGKATRIGVLRAYATRHGAGPFVTEDAELAAKIPDGHNVFNEWQRELRVGWHDLIMDRYAHSIIGHLDALAVTNLDRLGDIPAWKIAEAYVDEKGERRSDLPVLSEEGLARWLAKCEPCYRAMTGTLHEKEHALLSAISQNLGVPIGILSHGPSANEKEIVLSVL